MKKIIFLFSFFVVFLTSTFVFNSPALAQLCAGLGESCTGKSCCDSWATCQNIANSVNVCIGSPPAASTTFFGKISPPPGIANYAGGGVQGIVLFANNILKLVIVGGGIMTFLNILLAGMAFISAGGDPKKIEQASTKIWQSVLGLIVIAGSFVIAALIGWILFGDATAILSPKIYGPGP